MRRSAELLLAVSALTIASSGVVSGRGAVMLTVGRVLPYDCDPFWVFCTTPREGILLGSGEIRRVPDPVVCSVATHSPGAISGNAPSTCRSLNE